MNSVQNGKAADRKQPYGIQKALGRITQKISSPLRRFFRSDCCPSTHITETKQMRARPTPKNG
jgi:hypothetical protein